MPGCTMSRPTATSVMPGFDRASPILLRAQGSIGCTLSSDIDRFCCRGSKNWTLKDVGESNVPCAHPARWPSPIFP